MTLQIYISLYLIQTLLSGLIAIVSFYKHKKKEKLIILIGLLFAISFVFNALQYYGYALGSGSIMNVIGSVSDILSFVIIGLIYNLVTEKKYTRFILVTTVLFLAAFVFNLLMIQKDSIVSFNKLVTSLIIIVYAVIYFYRLMVDLPTVYLHRLPMFWINSAMLLYSAGTVFLFAFTTYLIETHTEDFINYWGLNLILFIVHQILILVGLFYSSRYANSDLNSSSKTFVKP